MPREAAFFYLLGEFSGLAVDVNPLFTNHRVPAAVPVGLRIEHGDNMTE